MFELIVKSGANRLVFQINFSVIVGLYCFFFNECLCS